MYPDRPDRMATTELLDRPERKELKARPELQEPWDRPDRWVPSVSKASLEFQVFQASTEPTVETEPPALKDLQVGPVID